MPVLEIAPPVTASPCTAVSRLSSLQSTPPCAPPCAPRRRRGSPASEQVDHQAAVGDRAAGDVVAAAADGDLEARLPCEAHRGGDVGRAAAAGDDRRPAIDQTVLDPAGGVVAVVAGREDPPGDAPG